MTDTPKCSLCGEPMPPGQEMFKFHGYPCPKKSVKVELSPEWCAAAADREGDQCVTAGAPASPETPQGLTFDIPEKRAVIDWMDQNNYDPDKHTAPGMQPAIFVAYDAALQAQHRARVEGLEARIKELEGQLLGNAVADDLHIRYRAVMLWLEQNNHSLLVTADGRWWVPDYPPADTPYKAIENARLSETRKEAP